MFRGQILEYPGFFVTDFQHVGEQLFFREGDRIRNVEQDNKIIIEQPGLLAYKFTGQGIWIRYRDSDNRKHFHDECRDLTDTFKVIEEGLPIAVSEIDGNKFIYRGLDKNGRATKLCLKDLKLKETHCYEGGAYEFKVVKDRIYAKNIFGEIICFDPSMKIVWQKEFSKENDSLGIVGPHLYENIVIASIGANEINRKDAEIVALSIDDGTVVWSRTFRKEPLTFLLIDDAVYFTQSGQMVVLDAATGETLVDEPSGFEPDRSAGALWSDGNNLFMIKHADSLIRIFSKDGKNLVQELKLPAPYVPSGDDPFVCHQGKYYLPLSVGDFSLKGVVDGLLVLEKSETVTEPAITIPEWPVMNTVLTLEGDDGKDFYHVLVTGDKLDDVLRYGSIKVKEIASTRGWQTLSDDRRNPNFGGKILFSSNIEELEAGAEDKIKNMLALAEKWMNESGVHAGNGKDPIRMELVPLPKG